MFLTAGYEMIDFLLGKGVRLFRCPGWSDYYPNHKGGNVAGRAVEGIPFDAAALGDWSDKVQPSLAKNYGFVVMTNELRSVQYFNRSPRAFAVASGCSCAPTSRKLRRRRAPDQRRVLHRPDAQGAHRPQDGQPPLWTNAAMEDLIVENGRVVGARVTHDGSTVNVEARKGVLLAAGGFGHNAEMRRRYSGDQPNEGQWSIANAGDTGEVLQAAMRPGRQDRPAGRSLVAAIGFHRQRRRRRRVARLRDDSAQAPSTSTRQAGGSATSPTPTSKSARRCTPTRRCRAG